MVNDVSFRKYFLSELGFTRLYSMTHFFSSCSFTVGVPKCLGISHDTNLIKRQHCINGCSNQITSPGWMHQTSAQVWCTGKTQREGVEKEVGGEIGMGNTCKSMADSCQCMRKPTTIL